MLFLLYLVFEIREDGVPDHEDAKDAKWNVKRTINIVFDIYGITDVHAMFVCVLNTSSEGEGLNSFRWRPSNMIRSKA